MKHFRPILVIMSMVMLLPAVAYANAGPAIAIQYFVHLMFLTWIIGIGEALLLCVLFRTFKGRFFLSMIAANIATALLGRAFIKSGMGSLVTGDVTIENLIPAYWQMVYVTFLVTLIIEFPFFVYALKGRKRLLLKAAAVTLLAHCIGYTLIFNWYHTDYMFTMVSELQVVPASTFQMEEDYDLYYISPDGKQVLRSDLSGNGTQAVAALNTEGEPKRLCACPRRIIKEIPEDANKTGIETAEGVCWDCGFDLYAIVNFKGTNGAVLLLENFSPRAAIDVRDDKYMGLCEGQDPNSPNVFAFRSFGDAKNWHFWSDRWGYLEVTGIAEGYPSYSSVDYRDDSQAKEEINKRHDGRGATYWVHPPFVQWTVENGSHIAGDYAVFKLGKDQICILDPEKKRIALIARGFGPVVAKPPLDNAEALPAAPEEAPQESVPTNEPTPEETPQDSVQTDEAEPQSP